MIATACVWSLMLLVQGGPNTYRVPTECFATRTACQQQLEKRVAQYGNYIPRVKECVPAEMVVEMAADLRKKGVK